ncbi:MAG: hypothetical protein AAGC67_00700 [Myxococcota bacterium]
MNWDAIGATAELLGAIAVFITLGYLTLQIRQNTQAVRAAAMNSSVAQIGDVRRDIYSDRGMAEIYLRGNEDPHALDPTELIRYRTLIHNMLMTQVNTFAQARYAGLPASSWESQAPILRRVLGNPGGTWFWENYRQDFEDAFRIEIERVLAGSDEDAR